MARALTKKQRGFVKDYIKTGNGTQSALKNYDTKDYKTAGVIAVENLAKPSIVKSIQEALPDDLLAEKHLALLNKTEIKRTFDHSSGEWIDMETGQIDAQAVSKGLDMAYKIKGTYAPEKSINVNITEKPSDKIKAIADELLEGSKS